MNEESRRADRAFAQRIAEFMGVEMAERESGEDMGPEAQPEQNAYDKAVARERELQAEYDRRRDRDVRLYMASEALAALITVRGGGLLPLDRHLAENALAFADTLFFLVDGKAK